MNFLKTLLVIIIAWYVIKYIVRLFSLIVVKNNNQGTVYHKSNKSSVIENINPKQKLINKDKGEYVDFEEIK